MWDLFSNSFLQENGTTETEKKGEDAAEEKSESTTAEEPKPEAAKKVDEWRVCGIKLVDSKKKEQSVGVLEGDNVKSSTYELEKGEFITEILGLFNKDKVAGLEGRGKHRKEMLAQVHLYTLIYTICIFNTLKFKKKVF